MAKGIKKFDQEIRVLGSWISIQNSASTSTLAEQGYGAYYSYNDKPYFANSVATWELASTSAVTNNTTLINSAIASGITFSDGTNSGIVGLGDTLLLTGGTDISIVYDSGTKKYTINNIASASDNYYLTAATFTTNTASASEVTFGVHDSTDVTLDMHKKLFLENLSGVSISGVADGDFLIYDSTTGNWTSSGITDDTLLAGNGISFDVSTIGQVTINNDLTAHTWKAQDGHGVSEDITWNDTVTFSGLTGIDVNYVAATNTFNFTNTSSAAVVSVTGISGLTSTNNAGVVEIGHTNNTYSAGITTSSLEVLGSVTVDDYGHVSAIGKRDLASALDARYVNLSGDTMSGELIINVASGQNAFRTSGDVTIMGNLYVSGSTVTVDTENLAIKDNIIVLNSGETGAGVSNHTAGIMVDRGSLSEYTFIFDEYTDTFRIGETSSTVDDNIINTGSTQAVATRQDVIFDNSFLFWNNTTSRIDGINDDLLNKSNNQIAVYDVINDAWGYSDIAAAAGIYSWNTISGDTGSITTSSVNDQFTIAGGYMIETDASVADIITINHKTSTYNIPTVNTNEFITGLGVDLYGHVTGATVTGVDFTVTANTNQFLSANTNYFLSVSADTGSYDASSVADGFTISGGTGITTKVVGSTIVIDNSENLETLTLATGTNTTVDTSSIDTNAKSIIVDYYINGDQEGQLRLLVNSGTITNEYQGDADVSFSDININGGHLEFVYTNNNAGSVTMTYFVKQIIA